jgi:hypothetical protein
MNNKILPTLAAAAFLAAGILPARANYAYISGFAVLSTNGATSGGTYYDLGFTATPNPNFQGTDLGTYLAGSTLLRLNGFEYNAWDDGSDNIYDADLYYRVYGLGSPSGSYTEVQGSFISQTGNDERFERLNQAANLVGSLTNGTYTLEVYTQMRADWDSSGFDNNGQFSIGGSGTTYSPASAPTFTASFTVIPEPGTGVALLGVLAAGLWRRRR